MQFKYFKKPSTHIGYFVQEYLKTISDNSPKFIRTGKNIMAVACGRHGKTCLEKIIQTFGYESFDYRIFVYDDTEFKEKIFTKCRITHENGVKWFFAKKYLSPEKCAGYDYIFCWDDDIDVSNFNVENFLEIMRKNELSMAQPALIANGNFSHAITVQNPSYKTGRFTDFVEIMAPVFRRDAWEKWWEMLEPEWNFWGWGYDLMFKSIKKIKKMGIIDAEAVLHSRPVSSIQNKLLHEEMKRFFFKHKENKIAQKINLRRLK